MSVFRNQSFTLAVAFGSLLLAACDVGVHGQGKDKNLDVRTAFGDVSVHTGESGPDTGLPVYPGAKHVRDKDEDPENVDIKLGTSFLDLQLATAKFESDDAPQAILDFYRGKMSAYGAVVECKGNIDFVDESKQPVCKEKPASSEIQLVTGSEDSHRLVSVKPRGAGSEFVVVSINVGGRS